MSLHPFFKRKNIIIFFFSFFFFLLFSFQVYSQERGGITVSPFLIEETINPGDVLSREIILSNKSNETRVFEIKVYDIATKENGEIVFLEPNFQRISLSEWIEISEKEIELLPQTSAIVSFFIKIPKIAAGSRQGVIVFQEKTGGNIADGEGIFATLSYQIGVLVFLTSKEGIKEEARILEFKTEKNYYFSPFEVRFLVEIENPGNVYFTPFGTIKIENFRKQEVANLIFNSQKLKVLPSEKRSLEESWQGNLGLGKYTASLFLNFGRTKGEGGEGIKTLFAQTSFWIFPSKKLFFIFSLLLFCLLVYVFKKKRKKNPQKNVLSLSTQVSVSVPSNYYNQLAESLKQKEEILNAKISQIQLLEKQILPIFLFSFFLLFFFLLVNFYLDFRFKTNLSYLIANSRKKKKKNNSPKINETLSAKNTNSFHCPTKKCLFYRGNIPCHIIDLNEQISTFIEKVSLPGEFTPQIVHLKKLTQKIKILCQEKNNFSQKDLFLQRRKILRKIRYNLNKLKKIPKFSTLYEKEIEVLWKKNHKISLLISKNLQK